MRGRCDGGNKMIELLASFLLCFIIKLRLYEESLSPDASWQVTARGHYLIFRCDLYAST